MANFFTPGPENIPDEILKVTPAFKKKVFLALLGLFVFITFYFGLMIWFGYRTYHLFYVLTHGGDNPVFLIITGICFAILTIFMFKSLIFFNKKIKNPYKQLTKEDQPDLYEFIHAVADETGAPKPHKIYLSDRVNASVSYDLSLINILIPSKKNLEVGLGLLNVLNLTEFKAILAHEFGHFAQRSMLLGRYVYVAHQIAMRIVYKRDILDNGLVALSSFDLRVAWIGWILSIIVWAIRSLIDVIFGIVVISERALSREMEFQADNVAVSVSGSDALIYGLHKLRAADEGYNESIGILTRCLQSKKAIPNLYTLQSNYIQKMRWVLDDPNYGLISDNIKQNENTRLFKNGLINPPEMWSTHPSDMDRENNAKRAYVMQKIDERGAIELVRNKQELFEEVTANLIKTAKVETEKITDEESLKLMDSESFDWAFLDPRYKGVYLLRGATRNFESISQMYDVTLSGSIEEEYAKLYPDSIKKELDLHREYEEEINLLEAAKNQVRTIENRKIVHRGNEIKRKEIPGILETLREQELEARLKLSDHDQRCRAVNFKAALSLHPSYGNYVKSIAQVLHYAEHSIADLNDVHEKFKRTLFVIFADGRVTETEQLLLISEARALRKVMHFVCTNTENITLNDTLLAKLKISKTSDLFEEFNLEVPEMRNIENWLNNYVLWYDVCFNGLKKLRNCTLELLLDSEDTIRQDYLAKESNFKLDSYNVLDNNYPKLLPGDERKVVEKLSFWDKFIGGIGLFPTIAKFSAAAIILIAAIFIGQVSVESTLHVHNGFDQDLKVTINGQNYDLSAHSNFTIALNEDAEILTKTLAGKVVDKFTGKFDAGDQHMIYNIGYGDYFVEYESVYGFGEPDESIFIGPERWFPAHADYIMEDAPTQIRANYSGETRSSIVPVLDDPFLLPELNFEIKEVRKMITNHAKLDAPNSKFMIKWLALVQGFDPELKIVKELAKKSPDNICAQRMLMDLATDAEKQQMHKGFEEKFDQTNNAGFKYLSLRAMENGPAQDSAFIKASKEFPDNGWLQFSVAYIYARDGNWQLADERYTDVVENAPYLRSAIAIDHVRIHRLNCELSNDIFFASNYYVNEEAEYYLRLDDGDESMIQDQSELIPHHINNEKFILAKNQIDKLSPDMYAHFLWMLAASQPDNQAAFDEAVATDPKISINQTNYGMVLALLASHNQDYSNVEGFMRSAFDDEDVDATLAFTKAIKSNNLVQANLILNDCSSYQLNTQLKMIACIMMKEKVPMEWWTQVNSLFFVSEKPYLGYCLNR